MELKLLQLREERNLSQEDVANVLQVTRQAYSRYERGERELGYSALYCLAKFFDVSIDYLIGNSEYFYPDKIDKNIEIKKTVPASIQKSEEYANEEIKLIEDYRALNPMNKKLIKQTMSALRSSAVDTEQRQKNKNQN